MTTVRRGIPTERAPLSIDQRIRRAAKRAEEGVQAAAAADGRVDDVLSGDEVFSAVNVGGTDVKPFLDKTDGAKLTDSSGLDSAVVSTAALSTNAATQPSRYDSAAEIDVVAIVGGSDPITSRLTIFSVTMTATGSEVQVDGKFFLRLQHSQDDVVLYVVVERTDSVSGPVDVFLATMQSLAISGDGFFNDWQSIAFSDTPAAGEVTYDVRVYHTYSIGSPGGFVTWKHRNRTMGFLETKR